MGKKILIRNYVHVITDIKISVSLNCEYEYELSTAGKEINNVQPEIEYITLGIHFDIYLPEEYYSPNAPGGLLRYLDDICNKGKDEDIINLAERYGVLTTKTIEEIAASLNNTSNIELLNVISMLPRELRIKDNESIRENILNFIKIDSNLINVALIINGVMEEKAWDEIKTKIKFRKYEKRPAKYVVDKLLYQFLKEKIYKTVAWPAFTDSQITELETNELRRLITIYVTYHNIDNQDFLKIAEKLGFANLTRIDVLKKLRKYLFDTTILSDDKFEFLRAKTIFEICSEIKSEIFKIRLKEL
jgi:hypothetical protein